METYKTIESQRKQLPLFPIDWPLTLNPRVEFALKLAYFCPFGDRNHAKKKTIKEELRKRRQKNVKVITTGYLRLVARPTSF